MKIALSQLNYTIGDFEGNKVKIINSINKAKTEGADLAVFAEMAISGTPAYDLLNKVTFLELCEAVLVEIASYCDGISVLVGLPIQNKNATISVAALIQDRRIVRYIGKKNIVTRDEKFYVTPSKGCEYIDVNGHRIAVVVGEDIKNGHEYGDYADTIVVISADRYVRGAIESRYEFFRKLAFTTGKNVLFVNQIGGHTDVVFDGSSSVFRGDGAAIKLLKSFEEEFAIIDISIDNRPIELPYQNRTYNVYHAVCLGLKDYFVKNGFEKACLGMSGGIDSAVVLAIAVRTIGAENIKVLMMPSQFSSDHSVDDAVEMAERLGVDYEVVPITSTYLAAVEALKPILDTKPFGVAEENIQSRIRCMMLMALSNKMGHMMLNTSNKSEAAVGYGTLYGDWAGAISVLGDIYKVEVFDLARYINHSQEIIPENIILKEPSAELSPNQKDSDTLPPYDVLDAILYRMIEEGQHREEIINSGFDRDVVYRVHSMVVRSEHKRYQSCPALRMSSCSFKGEREMPLTSKYGC